MVAANGVAALQMAQTAPPDVALDGSPGRERAKGQRGDERPLLVATTGYGSDEDRRRSDGAGLDLHLVKLVDLEQLRALLKRFHEIVE